VDAARPSGLLLASPTPPTRLQTCQRHDRSQCGFRCFRAAQFALAGPVTGGRGVSSCQLWRERNRCLGSRARRRTEPKADPPRLDGWMSLSRIAQTSDASMSPNRHRRIASKPIASWQPTPARRAEAQASAGAATWPPGPGTRRHRPG